MEVIKRNKIEAALRALEIYFIVWQGIIFTALAIDCLFIICGSSRYLIANIPSFFLAPFTCLGSYHVLAGLAVLWFLLWEGCKSE